MTNLLITGASGFVGRQACLSLYKRGFSARAFSRQPIEWPSGIHGFTASSLSEINYSSSALDGIECVLHLAGRAHVMHEPEIDPLSAFRNANVSESLKFAREAALAGVKRFVFVSSIKVNGDIASPSSPFTENDSPNPADSYGISKYEAELGLRDISAETGMEIVIVRPPLVYGAGVKGNFRAMMNVLASKVPLPLALITDNKRSLIALDNLIDLLALCVSHPQAAGRVFLVSDQQDVSTAKLLRLLGEAMGLTTHLFAMPQGLLQGAASLARKRSMYQRLCGSLVVDSSAASRLLGWSPPLSLEEGLRRASMDFLA